MANSSNATFPDMGGSTPPIGKPMFGKNNDTATTFDRQWDPVHMGSPLMSKTVRYYNGIIKPVTIVTDKIIKAVINPSARIGNEYRDKFVIEVTYICSSDTLFTIDTGDKQGYEVEIKEQVLNSTTEYIGRNDLVVREICYIISSEHLRDNGGCIYVDMLDTMVTISEIDNKNVIVHPRDKRAVAIKERDAALKKIDRDGLILKFNYNLPVHDTTRADKWINIDGNVYGIYPSHDPDKPTGMHLSVVGRHVDPSGYLTDPITGREVYTLEQLDKSTFFYDSRKEAMNLGDALTKYTNDAKIKAEEAKIKKAELDIQQQEEKKKSDSEKLIQEHLSKFTSSIEDMNKRTRDTDARVKEATTATASAIAAELKESLRSHREDERERSSWVRKEISDALKWIPIVASAVLLIAKGYKKLTEGSSVFSF